VPAGVAFSPEYKVDRFYRGHIEMDC